MSELSRTREPMGDQVYSDRELIALIVASYKFSRGEGNLQELMLHFFAANYGDRIDPERVEAIHSRATDAITKTYLNPKMHPRFSPSRPLSQKHRAQITENTFGTEASELKRKLTDWLLQLRNPGHINVNKLAYEVIDRDYYYMPIGDDESDVRITELSSNFRTPFTYYSNFVLYGLLRRDTGLEQFNHLYRAVGLAVLESEEPVHSLCIDVIEEHVKANPEDRKELERILIVADSVLL